MSGQKGTRYPIVIASSPAIWFMAGVGCLPRSSTPSFRVLVLLAGLPRSACFCFSRLLCRDTPFVAWLYVFGLVKVRQVAERGQWHKTNIVVWRTVLYQVRNRVLEINACPTFCPILLTCWDVIRAESAQQLGKMVEHPNQSLPIQVRSLPASPCTTSSPQFFALLEGSRESYPSN